MYIVKPQNTAIVYKADTYQNSKADQFETVNFK